MCSNPLFTHSVSILHILMYNNIFLKAIQVLVALYLFLVVHTKQCAAEKSPSVWQTAALVDISHPLIPIIGSTFKSALV